MVYPMLKLIEQILPVKQHSMNLWIFFLLLFLKKGLLQNSSSVAGNHRCLFDHRSGKREPLIGFSPCFCLLRCPSGSTSLLMSAFSCSVAELDLRLQQALTLVEMSCDSELNM